MTSKESFKKWCDGRALAGCEKSIAWGAWKASRAVTLDAVDHAAENHHENQLLILSGPVSEITDKLRKEAPDETTE
jgi:hypothetical protein